MSSKTPLSPYESKVRIHAHVAFFAFLVALPLGIFAARLLRTFTTRWFYLHAFINFFLTAPLVFTGIGLGYQATEGYDGQHWNDPHKKMGLTLLILYIIQVILGALIHYVKIPFRFGRAPQNYLHAVLGLVIVACAGWQTHYGLWVEWPMMTGNAHPVNWRCKQFWAGIVAITPILYFLGLGLLPRQFSQERAARRAGRNRDMKGAVRLVEVEVFDGRP
ncbi:hypothetical protein C8J57DRAFT_1312884 [Mycena rebaudengoi]|nr:hypothetical protein C8J57DRAFT_1312884 [Mycena rebaudengoi]